MADVDREGGALRVLGKGNKERLAYVRHGAKDALEDWLALRGDMPGPLFWPITKGGKLRPRRLSAQAMLYVARRRGQGAGWSASARTTCAGRSSRTCWTRAPI
jgi:site-specific recombinase XerC